MKLFWSTRSPFVRKVMIVVHELGLQDRLETVRVVVHPAEPSDMVMASNPVGKIPTLVLDDGDAIYDSRVICEYLDVLHGGGRFVPAAGHKRWRVLIWQALADGMIEISLLWLAERAKADEMRNGQILATCERKILAALDRLEKDEQFVSSAALTLGHIAVASELLYLDFRFADLNWRNDYPVLARWLDGLSKRPAIRNTAFADVY